MTLPLALMPLLSMRVWAALTPAVSSETINARESRHLRQMEREGKCSWRASLGIRTTEEGLAPTLPARIRAPQRPGVVALLRLDLGLVVR